MVRGIFPVATLLKSTGRKYGKRTPCGANPVLGNNPTHSHTFLCPQTARGLIERHSSGGRKKIRDTRADGERY